MRNVRRGLWVSGGLLLLIFVAVVGALWYSHCQDEKDQRYALQFVETPNMALSDDGVNRIIRYVCDHNNASGHMREKVVIALLQRLPSNLDMFIAILERYCDEPDRLAFIRSTTIDFINSQQPGSAIALINLNHNGGGVEIEELKMKSILGDMKNEKLLAAIVVTFSEPEMREFREELEVIVSSNEIPDVLEKGIQYIIRDTETNDEPG